MATATGLRVRKGEDAALLEQMRLGMALRARQREGERERDARIAANQAVIADGARSFSQWLQTLIIANDDPENPKPIPFEPWDYQLQLAALLEARESLCLLKARQLGISWLLAAYKLWRSAYFGWACAFISKGQDEARLHLGTPAVKSRVKWLWEHMPEDTRPVAKWTADNVQFPSSGGLIQVFPSTETAGTSYTFQFVNFDEFGTHPFAAANLSAIAPTTSAGGQLVILSTANPEMGPAGAFYDSWEAASDGVEMRTVASGMLIGETRGRNELRPLFIPVRARPGRDDAWLERERRKVGDADRADAQYPETPAQAFVGKAGLVFPQFSKVRHVREGHPVTWMECKARGFGVDWGGGDMPTAIVPLGLYQDRGRWALHQYGEYYERQVPSAQEVAAWILAFEREHGAVAMCTWVDAGSTTAGIVASLKSSGLQRVREGFKAPEIRRQETAFLLDHDMLTLEAECRGSIAEFAGYRWLERTDPNSKERYKTATPVDHHGDAIDARGEAIHGLMRVAGVGSSGRSVTKMEYPSRREDKLVTFKQWIAGEREKRRQPDRVRR